MFSNWIAHVGVGTPGFTASAIFDSQLSHVIVNSDLPTLELSQSFVPTGINASLIISQQQTLVPTNVTGPLAYETFSFNGIPLYGQEFLASSSLTLARMGFAFTRPGSSIASSNFVDALYQQGHLARRLIAFGYRDVQFVDKGPINIGNVDSSAYAGSFANYSVDVDNGQWAFSLENMQFGNISLGYNGFITVASASSMSMVPIPVLDALVSLIGATPYQINDTGETITITYLTADINRDALPPVTFLLNNTRLSIPAANYFDCSSLTFCVLRIMGTSQVDTPRAAFTIGTFALKYMHVVFDLD